MRRLERVVRRRYSKFRRWSATLAKCHSGTPTPYCYEADGELDFDADFDEDLDDDFDEDFDADTDADGELDVDADGELDDSARTSCVPMSVSKVNMY